MNLTELLVPGEHAPRSVHLAPHDHHAYARALDSEVGTGSCVDGRDFVRVL